MKASFVGQIAVLLAAVSCWHHEAFGVEGANVAARFHDWRDAGCRMTPGRLGMPSSGANHSGGNRAECPTCPEPEGQVRWWIDQPEISLWLVDQPLSYFSSTGEKTAFRWYYRQRYTLPEIDECPNLYGIQQRFSLGENPYAAYMRTYGMPHASWSHNWMMNILVWDHAWESISDSVWRAKTPVFSLGYEALVFRPEGSINYFSVGTNGPGTLSDVVSQAKLQPRSGLSYPTVSRPPEPDANNIYWGDNGAGFTLTYPDGSQDVFGLAHYQNYALSLPAPNTTARAFLTARVDPQGRTTLVGYESITYQRYGYTTYTIYRVRYVVDADHRTNTFLYKPNEDADHAWELAEITDPYGRKARFGYSGGVLTSITDPMTNTSYFSYGGPSNWLSGVTTPYGTTSFKFYDLPYTNIFSAFSKRAAYVMEPQGAHQLFYYLHHTNTLAATGTPPSVPGQSFDDGTAGTEYYTLDYRNSFHWDRQQFAALSSTVTNLLPTNMTNALASLTAQDFRKGRLKHWLFGADGFSITEALSSEREASPDAGGQTEGWRTWFNYSGKPSREREGNAEVSCIARVLPDGSSQYATFSFNGSQWQDVRSGSAGLLTNYSQYAANGIDLASLSNSLGQRVTLGYTNHLVRFATNALNQVASYLWDTNSWSLLQVQSVSGQSALLSYYPRAATNTAPAGTNSMLASITLQPQGRTIEFKDYFASQPKVVRLSGTGVLELWLTNSWDSLNRLTGTAFPDGSTVSNTYERLDLVATKDRMGFWTYFGYDGLEHPTWVQDARSNTTFFGWCDCGSLTSLADASNRVTSLFYNNQGLLTNVVYPYQRSRTNFFDSAGRLWKVSDGENRSFTFGFNNQGLVTAVSNAYGRVWEVVYDALDRPWTITDADDVTVTHAYDLLNRLTTRTWEDGIGETFGYATNGLIAYTNRNGKIIRFTRDAAGRPTYVTNANLEVTRYAYNALDLITEIWDGQANHTGFGFNDFGRLTSKTNALGQEVLRLQHDANGQVTNRWTPQFGNTTFSYDPSGNFTSFAWTTAPSGSIGYAYDKLNRLSGMADALGTTSFGYTGNGELSSEAGPWTDDLVSWDYKQGRRTSLGIGDSAYNFWQTYVYDPAWRLTNITSAAGPFRYGYSAANPASALVRTLSLPNFAWITNHHDSLSRLDYTALLDRWGHVLDGYGYSHDLAGLRKGITRELGITTNYVTVNHDPVGQITNWSARELSQTPRLHEQLNWVFDKAGNLLYRTNGALVQTFTNNALNELTGVSRSGTLTVSGATPAPAISVAVNGQPAERYGDFTFARTNLALTGNDTFTIIAQNQYSSTTNILASSLPVSVALQWDLNGNLTSDGTRSFFYNAGDRLTNVMVAGQWKAEFVYDGLGRRRVMREYGWQGSSWGSPTNETRYVCDGMLPIQERDGNNAVKVSYTRGPDLSGSRQGAGGIGGLLARTDGSGSLFYHADGAGNVTALTDTAGNVAARYEYGAFGRLVGKWGPMADANRVRFSSKAHLPHAEDIYEFGARDYLVSLQRWTSPDPLGVLFDRNLYRFNYNSPISLIDPDGLAPQIVGFTYNLNNAGISPLYVDQQFGQGYGIGLHGPLGSGGEATVLMGASMVPGVGEALDLAVLGDPKSKWWEKGIAGVSLGANALTGGLLPNAGGLVKGGKRFCKAGKADRPRIESSLPDRVTSELAAGVLRTPEEAAQARNFFERNREAAIKWWRERNGGKEWPKNSTHAEHPRALKDGGDPLFIEPGYGGPNAAHNIPRPPDGLTDAQRWGQMGGRPPGN